MSDETKKEIKRGKGERTSKSNIDDEVISQESDELSPRSEDIKKLELEDILKSLPFAQGEELGELAPQERAKFILHQLSISMNRAPEKLDPESVRILAETVDKNNQNKFEYLMLSEKNEAEARRRSDDLRVEKHNLSVTQYKDDFSVVKPTIYVVLALISVLTVFSLYLIFGTSKSDVGLGLLSVILASGLAYLAGGGVKLLTKPTLDDDS